MFEQCVVKEICSYLAGPFIIRSFLQAVLLFAEGFAALPAQPLDWGCLSGGSDPRPPSRSRCRWRRLALSPCRSVGRRPQRTLHQCYSSTRPPLPNERGDGGLGLLGGALGVPRGEVVEEWGGRWEPEPFVPLGGHPGCPVALGCSNCEF